jgi:hypothetical protein
MESKSADLIRKFLLDENTDNNLRGAVWSLTEQVGNAADLITALRFDLKTTTTERDSLRNQVLALHRIMRENDGEIADLVGVDRKSEDGDKLIEGVRKVVTDRDAALAAIAALNKVNHEVDILKGR